MHGFEESARGDVSGELAKEMLVVNLENVWLIDHYQCLVVKVQLRWPSGSVG